MGVAAYVLTIPLRFLRVGSLTSTERDVQEPADGNRTKHKPTRSGQPDCHVSEAVDAEEDAIGFGDDVGIGIGDRICITTQLCDGKVVALLIY